MNANKNIVVSVEEEYTSFALSLILKREKYKVTYIKNELEALNYILLRRNTPEKIHLFITENAGSCTSADELMKLLIKSNFNVPVVIITGDRYEKSKVEIQKTLQIKFIKKPFITDEFIRTLNDILNEK